MIISTIAKRVQPTSGVNCLLEAGPRISAANSEEPTPGVKHFKPSPRDRLEDKLCPILTSGE